jgi:hypothetical protein
MDAMTTHKRSQHRAAAETPPQPHDRAAAWMVLVGAGATTVSFNIWHALHSGMPLVLAPLEGMAPVLIAMGLSHVVSAYRGGWFMKTVTFGIMLAAMVLSLDAAGKVVHPALGPLWWLFGAVVDAAALVALQVILSPESRAAARAVKKASRDAALSAALEATAEATGEPREEPLDVPAEVPPQGPVQVPRQRPARISEEPDARKARADYRRSLQQGAALSPRKLGEKFGRSRTWGAGRIAEVQDGPHLTEKTGS